MKVIIDIPEIPTNDKQRWALANGKPYLRGEWIKQFDVKTQSYTCTCSVCGDTHRLLINYFLESNFCPNCGSDNRKRGEAE